MTDCTMTPAKTTSLVKKRRVCGPPAKPKAKLKRRRKLPSPSDQADSSSTTPTPPTDMGTPTQSVELYASAMDDAKAIVVKYKEPKKQLRAEVARLRDEHSAALTDARQNKSIDSLCFPRPDGGISHLTFKTNTTYPQVKRASVEAALRWVTATAVMQVHKRAPTKTLSECVAEVLLARLKFDLRRVNTQTAWTKGPPIKGKCGSATPVIQAAPPHLVEKYVTLETKKAELKALVAAQKVATHKVEETKKQYETQAKAYLAPLKQTQDTVTVVKVDQAGKPTRVHEYVLRLRETKPKRPPAVKVKTLERALPLTQVASVLMQGGEVDFSVDDVDSVLAGSREALMSAYDLVHAKYAVVQAIKARVADRTVLRLGRARSCREKAT